jgi:hypothetical protein
MKAYRQNAENMRLALIAGLVSVPEIVQWADKTLSAQAEYDDDLADLSLAIHSLPQDVEAILRRLAAGADLYEGIRSLAGRMHRALLKDRARARDFTRILEQLWIETRYIVPEDLRFITGVDDEFALAEQGVYGTVEGAIDDLIRETERYDRGSEQEARPYGSPAAGSPSGQP